MDNTANAADPQEPINTKQPTSVYWDIEEPHPAIIGKCLVSAAEGKKPPLLDLLPWARSAIDKAIDQWATIGNDPALIHVDVHVIRSHAGELPHVHAHFGDRHTPDDVPVTIIMEADPFDGFEASTTIARRAATS
jgi:hypothetical protein